MSNLGVSGTTWSNWAVGVCRVWTQHGPNTGWDCSCQTVWLRESRFGLSKFLFCFSLLSFAAGLFEGQGPLNGYQVGNWALQQLPVLYMHGVTME